MIDPERRAELERLERIKMRIGFVLLVMIAALLYFVVMTFVPLIGDLKNLKGHEADAVLNYLGQESGVRGYFALAALQIVQVLSIFLPGAAVQIAGGLIFGTWKSFLICYCSFVFANSMMFYLNRHIPALSNLLPKDNKGVRTISEWLNSADPTFMTMLAFMMPGVPNGFVPYVAARTKTTLVKFTKATAMGSFVNILVMCTIGAQLEDGDWLTSAVLMGLKILVIGLLYKYKDQIIAFRKMQTGER